MTNEKELIKKIATVDYQVIMQPGLPMPEVVTLNNDNSYTIFIDDSLSIKEKRRAFFHAIRHIFQDDFYSAKPADDIEKDTHLFD